MRERLRRVETWATVLADEHRVRDLTAVRVAHIRVDAVGVVGVGIDDVRLAAKPEPQLEEVAHHAVAAELAAWDTGDAAAVDDVLADKDRLGEARSSGESVQRLGEVDAPVAVRVGRPVTAVVRPRIDRTSSVPGDVDPAGVAGCDPREDVRA